MRHDMMPDALQAQADEEHLEAVYQRAEQAEARAEKTHAEIERLKARLAEVELERDEWEARADERIQNFGGGWRFGRWDHNDFIPCTKEFYPTALKALNALNEAIADVVSRCSPKEGSS